MGPNLRISITESAWCQSRTIMSRMDLASCLVEKRGEFRPCLMPGQERRTSAIAAGGSFLTGALPASPVGQRQDSRRTGHGFITYKAEVLSLSLSLSRTTY